jgi:hypothetical protein
MVNFKAICNCSKQEQSSKFRGFWGTISPNHPLFAAHSSHGSKIAYSKVMDSFVLSHFLFLQVHERLSGGVLTDPETNSLEKIRQLLVEE